MQKVAIMTHKTQEDLVLETLQKQGVLQISKQTDEVSDREGEVKFKEAELQFAIDTLADYMTPEIEDNLKIKLNDVDLERFGKQQDVSEIIESVHSVQTAKAADERLLSDAQAAVAMLEPWAELQTGGAQYITSSFLGTIPKNRIDDFSDTLKKKVKTAYLERLSITDDKQTVRITGLKSNHATIESLATEFGFTASTNVNFDESIQSQLATHIKTVDEVSARASGREEVLATLAQSIPDLQNMKRYLGWEESKEHARTNMEQTSQTKIMHGWMPKNKIKSLETVLAGVAPTSTILPVEPKEGEVAPIALKNRWWMKPFEAVTTLYGLPNNSEFDPTSALSPFFILFYALCLTDAGYGVILTLVFGIYILVKKVTIDENPLFWLLLFSGIVTTLVGIPFGGWMGLDPAKVANHIPALTTERMIDGVMTPVFLGQIWHLGKESGISFLQNLSLVLGIVHLFTGMFLAGWHKFVHGKKAEAMWNDFTPHLLLGAILLYVFQGTTTTMWIMVATIAILVWGKGYGSPWYLRPLVGFAGLLNFSIGMLTNSLSYLRILALGLVTGAIAGAVNQVAVEVGTLFPTGVDYLIIAIIFIGGHVVSVVLNALGSFIHSGRLQFIEFFGQFFEGGGKPFTPFKRS